MAAALAFYTVFSLAPLLFIVLGVAGLFYDQAQARSFIFGELQKLVGAGGANWVVGLLDGANRQGSGILATLIGVATLFLGATGVLVQLQQSLATIAGAKESGRLWNALRMRLLAFGFILALGFLVLVSLLVNAALTALFASGQGWVWRGLEFVVTSGLMGLFFTLMYKYLSQTSIPWTSAWTGGLTAALLFNVGKFAIGFYLGNGVALSPYGAAGSLVLLLLWVYYSAQIVLVGAELSVLSQHRAKWAEVQQP